MTLLDDYASDLALRKMATARGHVYIIAAWIRWCDSRQIAPLAISREDLRAYLAARQHLKMASLQKEFSTIAGFYEFLEDNRKYSGSAIRDIKAIKKTYLTPYKSDSERRQLITIDQAAEMVRRTLKTRDQAILLVLLKTGIRLGELVDIDIEDIDLAAGTIRLKSKAKRTNRTVYFDDECQAALRRWLKVRAGIKTASSALFVGEKRGRLGKKGVLDLVIAAARRIGVHQDKGPLEKRFTPHCCRHWWNTYLLLAGLEERYRAHLRGDVPAGSQGRYIHLDAEVMSGEIRRRYLECIPRLGIS